MWYRASKTVPYTPEPNGGADKANRTTVGKARSMVADTEILGGSSQHHHVLK
jgi:hypothetical protein